MKVKIQCLEQGIQYWYFGEISLKILPYVTTG